ncbi:hypothetical protein EE612_031462 [Oryza sativa]|nr:hypothetical protein EE612_031462 [Oryza sativa]
MGQRINTQHN